MEKREKGLCFNCDEKYSRNHECKGKLFALLIDNEDTVADTPSPTSPKPPDPTTLTPATPHPPHPEISYHALDGQLTPHTFRLTGFIHINPIQILIVSGSTHNFIQLRLVQHLQLPITEIPPFQVLIGNGDKLACHSKCTNLSLLLQQHTFLIEPFAIPLQGADLVLGVQWLQTLGNVFTNYSSLTMTFHYDNTPITLHGSNPIPINQIQFSQYIKLSSQCSIHSCFALSSLAGPSTTPPSIPPDLSPLLHQYSDLFSEPPTLPPHRPEDHHITLKPNTPPINVRPYRYPHFQKTTIEQLVSEMLQQGIIQPSKSPFSSPVLLVKKKDGTWRFCVDYRALNAATIPNKYPIPTVDEMLDELYGSTIFSKLDLRSGLHQVRMHDADRHMTAFCTHQGHYEFTVMPFGLTNAPSTFQNLMNNVLQPFLRKFVIVFFDDILVYSCSPSAHQQHLQTIFACLRHHQLFLRLSKCSFGQPSVEYLGQIIAAPGITPTSEKVAAILQWPTPSYSPRTPRFFGPSWLLLPLYPSFCYNRRTTYKPSPAGRFPLESYCTSSLSATQKSPSHTSNSRFARFLRPVHN